MNLLLLRASSLINSKFLYYSQFTSHVKHSIRSIAKLAVNQASISTTELKRYRIFLPSANEQHIDSQYPKYLGFSHRETIEKN